MKMTPAFIQEVFAKATLVHSRANIMLAFDKMAQEMQAELADKNPVLLTVIHGG